MLLEKEESFIRKFTVHSFQRINFPVLLSNLNLPYNSVIHLIDNFDADEELDIFRDTYYGFLDKKILRVSCVFYNNINFTIGDRKKSINYRFTKQSFPKLMDFNNKIRRIGAIIRDSNSLDNYIRNKSKVVIVNHNPIYNRLKLYLTKKYLYKLTKFEITLDNVDMFILEHSTNDNNFLFIPVKTDEIVPISVYREILRKETIPTHLLKKFNSDLFFTISNFLLFLNDSPNSITGVFSKHNSKEDLSKIFIVFFNPTTQKSFVFNLNHMKLLIDKRSSFMFEIIKNIYGKLMEKSFSEINNALQTPISKVIESSNDEEEEEVPIEIKDKKDIIVLNKKEHEFPKYENINEPFGKIIVNEFDSYINENTILSNKQKEKFKKYITDGLESKVKIDGETVTIKDIIEKPVNTQIESSIDLTNKTKDTPMEKGYASNNTTNYQKEYMEKHFRQDMFKSLLSFSKVGLIFRKYEEENEVTDLNMIKHVKVTFTNIDGKTKTIKFKIPIIDSDGNFRVNGVKSYMKLQMTNNPIVKLNEYKVSLTSNYGKTIIERKLSKRCNLDTFILQKNSKSKNPFQYTSHSYSYPIELPFEYTSIGKNIKTITNDKYRLFFTYDKRNEEVSLTKKDLDDLEKKYGVLFGKGKDTLLFINKNNIVSEVKGSEVIDEGFILDYIFLEDVPQINPQWIEVLILDKRFPMVFILGYKYGLSTVLKELNVTYRTVEKGKQLNLLSYEVPIRFKDRTLIIPRYPLFNSWIISGLTTFNHLSEIDMDEMDIKDTYYILIQSKGMSINYLKGIDNFFNFFVDPITEDILRMLNEPVTPKALLYRAVEMLLTEYHREPSSIQNYRLKGLEKINGLVYNEIGRQYAQYLNDKSKNTTFTINTEAVIMKILQDQSVTLVEETNPIHYLKERTAITYGGFLGRQTSAFVDKDIKYPNDGLGILSEAVPDSKKVGFNSFTPMNMMVENTRGIVKSNIDINELESGNILSVSGALMPFSTNDDAKRLVFINIQLSHHVPSLTGEPCRVRTGAESFIGYYTNPLYSVVAIDDGVIESINEDLKKFKVKYKKLGSYVYSYGDLKGTVSSNMINHSVVLNELKEGKKVKKDDILAYNEGFFKLDPIFKQLNWCHGVPAKIAILDNRFTLEDSCAFTKEYLKKLKFKTIYPRAIKITSDLMIDEMVDVGTSVTYNTRLIQLKFSDVSSIDIDSMVEEDDIDEDNILTSLNTLIFKSKYRGIVKDIRIYHTQDISEYNSSIQKILIDYYKRIRKLKRFGSGVVNSENVNIQSKIEPGTRIKKLTVDENEILIIFDIAVDIDISNGDKLVIDNSLKTIVGEVIDYDLVTKSGIKVDGIFGGKSIFNRIITSPIKLGLLEQVLEKIEDTAINMYFE